MARSEHATRRDPRDPGDLDRKRRVKRLVEVERARPRGAPGHGDAAGIPITTRDDGPYVHYPAGADDLRAILARVPHGTADGLGDIELCLDRTPLPPAGDHGRGRPGDLRRVAVRFEKTRLTRPTVAPELRAQRRDPRR